MGMIRKRKVAYRHTRSIHYHHRIPVTSVYFEKRYHHHKYAILKPISSGASVNTNILVGFHVFDKLSARKNADDVKKLFEIKKKQKSGKNSNLGKKKKKHGKHYALKMFLLKLVIVAGIFWFIYQYVFGITILYGNYMYPSVRDGDLVISYKLQKPVTNDLIMYEHNGELMVGRVVAKENSVIRFNSETETYSVNDITPSESIFYTTLENPDADIEYPYTVPAGCVYVLADHRED